MADPCDDVRQIYENAQDVADDALKEWLEAFDAAREAAEEVTSGLEDRLLEFELGLPTIVGEVVIVLLGANASMHDAVDLQEAWSDYEDAYAAYYDALMVRDDAAREYRECMLSCVNAPDEDEDEIA